MSSTPFEKGLRGNGGSSTPRTAKHNTRYMSGSKGPGELDDAVSSPDSASPAVSRTPSATVSRGAATSGRQGGTYSSPFREMHGIGGASRATPRVKSTLATASKPPVPRQNSNVNDNDGDAVSITESDDVSVMTEDDYAPQEGDSVQVFVRVRPVNSAEAAEDQYRCTHLFGERGISLDLRHRSEPYQFKFDAILPEETTQEEVFERAGRPIVDNCMGGYNSSIFAYGQTGAGKTYTMQGPLAAAVQEDHTQRGLAPRVFQYLFSEIDKAQDENCHENLTFCCKCSMLEIYNEVVTDLLNPAATNLQIREDIKRGCYVEDLSEHTVQNTADAMRLMRIGAENRHVGETRLNRESSRSHSVFTCVLERQSKNQATGITNVLFSRLNLIDLAGSERVHGGEHGGSQATGKHFKEACHINKSLTTLGRVITELVEAQRTTQARGGGSATKLTAAARARHVPYRDSRLTFLLQDSLGGNAKTLMIANISPSSVSAMETLSTLNFMSRAKCIRNRAQINLDARGDVALLQREIARLNNELDNLRKGYTEPAIQENKLLRDEVEKLRTFKGEADLKLQFFEKDNQNLKSERRRLDNKLAQIQKGASQLDSAVGALALKIFSCEDKDRASRQLDTQIADLERQILMSELAAQQHQGADVLQQQVDLLQEQLQAVQAAADSSSNAAEAASAELEACKQQLDEQQQRSASLAAEVSTALAHSAGLAGQLSAAQQQAEALSEQLQAAEQERAGLSEQLSTDQQESAQKVANLQNQLNASQHEAATLSEQLAASQQETADLQAQVAAMQQQCADLAEQLTTSQATASGLQEQLQAALVESASVTEQLSAVKREHAELLQQLEAAREEAAVVAAQVQEERDAIQAQLSELTASLEASTAEVGTLKQQLQDSQQEAQALREDGDALRQQLDQQQQDNVQVTQQLADTQEQLMATKRELAQAQEMATCSEEEAGKRLADAQAAAEAAQQELQEANSSNASLQEQLQALQEQLMQSQQQLQQEAEARREEANAAASSQAAADAIEQQLREQLATLQQSLGARGDDLTAAVTEKQDLQSRLGLKQQQYSELQQQLQAEQGRSAEGRSQVAALEEALANLNADIQAKNAALEAAQDQVKQLSALQQQKEDALAAAAAKHEQLNGDLAAARESSKGKQEELMKQVTDVHLQLSAAQQEQERLQEELESLRTDNSSLQAQLADAQGETDDFRGQATSKSLEVELLRKKLAAADASLASLRGDLQETQQEAAHLRLQVQNMESDAGESQAAAEEQLNDLKRVLLDKDQLLQEFEYERGQMQRRMEELSQRLADKSSSLDSSRAEVQALKANIRDKENAARKQDAALSDIKAFARQLQTENASLSSRLHEVEEKLSEHEAEFKGKLCYNELQLKEQIVYNARNRQAMNEIRKVINWAQQVPVGPTATTPPHGSTFSRPSSSASRRVQTQPFGHLDAGGCGSSIPGSPAGSSMFGDLLAAEQQFDEQQQQQASVGGAAGGEGCDPSSRAMMPPPPPALMLPPSSHGGGGGGSLGSSSSNSSSRHGHHHSRQHHHQHHGQQQAHYGQAAGEQQHRYGEPAADGSGLGRRMSSGSGGNSGSSRRTAGIGSNGSRGIAGSPGGAHLPNRGGAEMLPLMLQVSADLEATTPASAAGASPAPAAGAAYSERDTAGGGVPASPTVSELTMGSANSSRSRSHRVGSPTRSSTGSKQQLAAALAAAQHKAPDQQQQHHHHHSHARHQQQQHQQERYAAAHQDDEVEDDTLGAPGPEESFEEQAAERGELAAGDGSRHLMAPQQASSPVPPSPQQEGAPGSLSRSKAGGRDTGASRRGALRAGSDAHCFSSLNSKRHKLAPGEMAHPGVVLSVSGEWSAGAGGGHDSIPDMRLPAAIVGDDGGPEA